MHPVVSTAIQHHPSRVRLLADLGRQLGGSVEIVADTDPDHGSPLRTYLDALRRTPPEATHRLVVQDDARCCRGFPRLMRDRVAEKPDAIIAFFTPGCAPHKAKIRRAVQAGEPWALLHSLWMPTVALCWPVGYAAEFVAWAETTYGGRRREMIGDDGPVGIWASRRRATVYATVPSLIQHPDVEPSLFGRKARAGANKARVAALYAD